LWYNDIEVSPVKSNIDIVWELIDTLTLEEKKTIYKRMQREIDSRLMNILDNVSERAATEPVLFDEITKEVESVRSKNHDQY
jgi:hypothetical protein